MRGLLFSILLLLISALVFFQLNEKYTWRPFITKGKKIDSFNGVYVYFNGDVSHVEGRNLSPDGYNFGLKFQCVEFVKRYYYDALHFKMPDTYGNAVDFFNPVVSDGKLNSARGLLQYSNGSNSKPAIDDILVFDVSSSNPYGHVAIISDVTEHGIEIFQQNPGRFVKSRVNYDLIHRGNKWIIDNKKVLGWLRVPN